MRVAGIVQDSIVDGPGFRLTVFVQGCTSQCEGCHNLDTWDINGGTEMSVDEISAMMQSNPLTDGLTVSGGEPFLQAVEVKQLAESAKQRGLSVWIYSGFTFEQLITMSVKQPEITSLLEQTDVLIDGPFILAERTLMLKWRGSKNQRVIDVQKSLESGTAVEMDV